MNVYQWRSDRWLRRHVRSLLRAAWRDRTFWGLEYIPLKKERLAAELQAEIDRRASLHA